MIGRSGERGSGISVLAARHDDDDDDEFSMMKYISRKCYYIMANNYLINQLIIHHNVFKQYLV